MQTQLTHYRLNVQVIKSERNNAGEGERERERERVKGKEKEASYSCYRYLMARSLFKYKHMQRIMMTGVLLYGIEWLEKQVNFKSNIKANKKEACLSEGGERGGRES